MAQDDARVAHERGILGAMLLWQDWRAEALTCLDARRFQVPKNQALFRAMARLPGHCEQGAEIGLLMAMDLPDWGAAELAELIDAPGAETHTGARAMAQRLGLALPPLTRASDVRPVQVSWLWGSRVPLGKTTILAGPPGVGKTLLSIELAARVSRGRAIPHDWIQPMQGDVIIVSSEDDADDTLVPRLIAADADLDRVHIWPDDMAIPSLPDEIDTLEAHVRQVSAALVIVDPLSILLSATLSSHRDADVRRIYGALKRLGPAILGIAHLNKSSGSALTRVTGSGAWVAAARSALVCASALPDEGEGEDPDEIVVAPLKCNLARRPPSVRLRRIVRDEVPCLEWWGECSTTADELIADRPQGRPPEARDAAADWLTSYLSHGPQAVGDIVDAAAMAGHSRRTIYRVREDLDVVSSRSAIDGVTYWSLP